MTPKQKAFVQEYLKDLNATQAAIRAGYSVKTAHPQGARLLTKATIKEAVQKAMAKRSERTEITQDRVLKELALIAFSRFSQVAEVKNDRLIVKDFSKLSDEDLALIKSVKEGKYGLEITTQDRMAALDSLCRHLGMYKDKTELSLSENLIDVLTKARARTRGKHA